MATKITVTYKNENYILEYSRLTASAIEKQGFVLDDLTNKPNIMIPLLVDRKEVHNFIKYVVRKFIY